MVSFCLHMYMRPIYPLNSRPSLIILIRSPHVASLEVVCAVFQDSHLRDPSGVWLTFCYKGTAVIDCYLFGLRRHYCAFYGAVCRVFTHCDRWHLLREH